MKKRLLLKKEYNLDIWDMPIEKVKEYDKFNVDILKEIGNTNITKELIEI